MIGRKMICIECPRGCDLQVFLEDGKVTSVEGNLCPRGKKYATDECEAPRRMVTGTVRAENGELLPVRTAAPVLRAGCVVGVVSSWLQVCQDECKLCGRCSCIVNKRQENECVASCKLCIGCRNVAP